MPERPRKSETVSRSDFPTNHSALPRSRVVEIIERFQENALRQLREEGVPETEALAIIRRFNKFSIQVLREMDSLYRQFEELLAHAPERSAEHQEWLETKTGGLLLTLEAFIAALVAETINKAKEDYRTQLSQPREVIAVPPQRSRQGWLAENFTAISELVWIAGTVAGFVMAWQLSGSFVVAGIGFLVPFLLWLKAGKFRWALLIPLSGITLEVWLLFWLYVVEGLQQ